MAGYKIKSSISESTVESAVSSLLGYLTPFSKECYILDSTNETLTGADKSLNIKGCLCYLQYKKSEGLRPLKNLADKMLSIGGKKNEIRKMRSEYGLISDPILYFELRKKAKEATDFQHNVLLAHNKPPISYASYVAPLSLNEAEYRASLVDPMLHMSDIHLKYYNQTVMSRMNRFVSFPVSYFLYNHISITPHTTVSSSDHAYSYSIGGSDIAWHSPEVVQRRPSSLFSRMDEIFSKVVESNSETLSSVSELAAIIDANIEGYFPNESKRFKEMENPWTKISSYGKLLREVHGINQYVIFKKV